MNSSADTVMKPLLVAVGVVPPSKRDLIAVERDEAVVGNCDAVGVAAKVADHLVGPTKGGLGIDDPAFSEECAQKR